MSRATRAVREAASAVTGAQAGPSRVTQSARNGRNRQSHFLILNDIPSTASATDVLRALQEINVVKSDFSASKITMPPPSFPRRASLTKSVHITLEPNPDIVRHAHERINGRPPFPDLSGLAHGRKPSNNLGMRPVFPFQSTDLSAREWVESQVRSIPTTSSSASSASSGAGAAGVAGVGQRRGARTGWNADRVGVQPDRPDIDWCMDTRVRGRRVVVKGLPGMVDQRFVRLLGEDCGVEQGNRGRMQGDDVKQVPASTGSFVSTWVITTDSVASACRLVRKLNRQYYNQGRHQNRYPLRAEIVW